MSSEHHDHGKDHSTKDEKDEEKAARRAEQDAKSASARPREDLGKKE